MFCSILFPALFVRWVLVHGQHLSGPWSLAQQGTSGVSAMQLAIVTETKAIILDKVEHNPLMVKGHVAWASEFDLTTGAVRALNPLSNTWCATGSFLSNGTLVSSAGNPVAVVPVGQDGLQAIRLFTPCNNNNCDIYEDQTRLRMSSKRWYPSSVRLQDGSVLIYGGSNTAAYRNDAKVNNPTYEFFPPKNIAGFNGVSIPAPFLSRTLNNNQFPKMTLLPSGDIFIAANRDAIIFDWKTNKETPLPRLPNGVHIGSPATGGYIFLPLQPPNYTPEVLICGGTSQSDTLPLSSYSSQTPASSQCARMVISDAGIAAGWQVEQMPTARVMPDMINLPDGRILIVNGAQTGMDAIASVRDPVGESNSDHPALLPVIYDPAAPVGARFSSEGLVASAIPRMYHSTATLTPNGTIMVAGSNPNTDMTRTGKYPTEYRIEFFSPPYMAVSRPMYTGLPQTIDFGTVFDLNVNLPSNTSTVSVSLMDLGFSTHGLHMDQRLLVLTSRLSADGQTLHVEAPISATHYPPGPAFLFILTNNGVPSFGSRTMIGKGQSPPVDAAALANMLALTSNSAYAA